VPAEDHVVLARDLRPKIEPDVFNLHQVRHRVDCRDLPYDDASMD